jgi:phosphosulfolactate phosphohydrolase-like enzyme
MADKKVTALTSLTTGASEDLFLVVDDPNGTPASKSITHKNLFGAVSSNVVVSKLTTLNANVIINCSNTSISSNVNMTGSKGPKVTAGYITLNAKTTVSSNNATTVLSGGGLQGSIFWDATYLYVATSNTQVKRVALSVF